MQLRWRDKPVPFPERSRSPREPSASIGPQDSEYASKLTEAGFEDISIEPTRVYKVEDARQFLTAQGMEADSIAPDVKDKFMSAFILAKMPM